MTRLQCCQHASTATSSRASRILIGVLLLAGVCIAIYPMTARWFSQLAQSELIGNYSVELSSVSQAQRREALEAATEYNAQLNSGSAFDPFTQGIVGTDSPQYRDYLAHLSGVPHWGDGAHRHPSH